MEDEICWFKAPFVITLSMYSVLFVLHVSTDSQSHIQSKDVTETVLLQCLVFFTIFVLVLSSEVLAGKPEGKRPLGRPRHRWVDNIRTDLQEVGCGYMDWIGLAQDRDRWRTLVSAVMNVWVPWNAGNFLTSCKPVGFSRRTLHHGVELSSEPTYYRKYVVRWYY